MLPTIFANDNHETNRRMAYLMTRINYDELYRNLAITRRYPYLTRRIVLMEYVNHSNNSSNIAEVERFPNTHISVHDFLSSDEGKQRLNMLFIAGPHMKLYTRRKVTQTYELTKYRQLVLEVSPQPMEVPSPILNQSSLYEEPYHCVRGVEGILD